MTILSPVKSAATPFDAYDQVYQVFHDRRMSGISAEHAEMVQDLLPSQAEFAKALVPALNFHLHPALPFFVSLLVLREQLQNGKHGTMAPLQVSRMPLSVIAEQNGRLVRYLTPVIALARISWLTANMAMKNRLLLEPIYRDFGVEVLTTCTCSGLMTHAGMGKDVLESSLVRRQDEMRSATDRLAIPVYSVTSLDQIPTSNADLTAHEIESFGLMEKMLDAMASRPSLPLESDILAQLRSLRADVLPAQ